MTIASPPSRYDKPRKGEYTVGSLPETFIVPILRDRITRLIDEYCGKLPKPARVLDVGCGRQPFRVRIEALGCSYAGFDVQQTAEESVEFVGALDEPLPAALAAGGEFNFLLCTEVLEHVADWGNAFRNLAALTQVGGHVLVTCPHFYPLHEEPYDFWRATLHAVFYHANANALTVVRQEATGDGWDVLGTLLGSCLAVPHQAGMFSRIGARFVNIARRFLFSAIRTGIPQRFARLPGVYLSNVVVLEKR